MADPLDVVKDCFWPVSIINLYYLYNIYTTIYMNIYHNVGTSDICRTDFPLIKYILVESRQKPWRPKTAETHVTYIMTKKIFNNTGQENPFTTTKGVFQSAGLTKYKFQNFHLRAAVAELVPLMKRGDVVFFFFLIFDVS